MHIGVPKEIKNNENRVGLSPMSVYQLTQKQHQVTIQSGAGLGAGFLDDDYKSVGAIIVQTAKEVFREATLIVKVKEPLPEEYQLIKSHHTVFTYFHFAASQSLTEAMLQTGATCIAYETITSKKGGLPLLAPMSEVAGKLAVQEASKYLLKTNGGKGKLIGGVTGVDAANIIILGAGIVGTASATVAAGMGANVTLLDVNIDLLRELQKTMPVNVTLLHSSPLTIKKLTSTADVIIGAVLIPGGKAPKLITQEMLSSLEARTVLIDVAVDQGGCIETMKPTTHSQPVYEVEDIIHYGVANMPGAVPYTSTLALNNVTSPFVVQLADKGWQTLAKENPHFASGVNITGEKVTHREVAEAFDLTYTNLVTLV